MLIVLQFPIFDIRRFQPFHDSIIKTPQWISLTLDDVNKQFVRTIGVIKYRKSGGNSAGENYFASAKRAIRFSKLPEINYQYGEGKNLCYKLKPSFRRFFFDGFACGKYEVGFVLPKTLGKELDFKNIIEPILRTKVKIPIYPGQVNEIILLEAGKYLAAQYQKATTGNSYHLKNSNGVTAGSPFIFLERNGNEEISFNSASNRISLGNIQGCKLNFSTNTISNKVLKVWDAVIQKDRVSARRVAREFRITALSAHAIRETFYFVLKQIYKEELLPKRDTFEAKQLNYFLKKCCGKYLNPNTYPASVKESDYEGIVLSFEDRISGGERDKLRENLKGVIEIRGNIFKEVLKYLEKQEHASSKPFLSNGNTYIINGGIQGAVGDNARASSFNELTIENTNLDSMKESKEKEK